MSTKFKWVFAGAMLAVAAGAANAQETAVTSRDTADLPWYQRFSSSTGLTESLGENDRLPQPSWTLSQRWGVTVDVREAQRLQTGPDRTPGPNETALGAYYQFTPRVRVGGEVSLAQPGNDAPVSRAEENTAPAAGVRIQSAFRF